MTEAESIALLRNQLAEEHRRAADDRSLSRLAARVGEMPIMLELVGKQLNDGLRRGKPFAEALHFVEEILDRKQIDRFRRDGGVRREASISRTIEASLEFLDQAGDRELALELGIFPAETEVPLTTVACLWQLDDLDTELVATHLADLALIKLSATTLRMHEVFRRYFFEKYAERSGPASLHARLIDGWGGLFNLPDIYAWRHLARHLIEAGRKDRLREMLLDYRWLRAKLRATDAIALRDDAARFPDDQDLRYLARALGQSAHLLARDPTALRGQLYGRLMAIESAEIERLLEQIGQASEEGPWLRPLHPSLTPADTPLLQVLEGHGDRGIAVAVTPDGRTAVSGSLDGTLRVWDLTTGQEMRALKGRGDAVHAVAMTPDGRSAHSDSWHRTVRVRDLATGQARVMTGDGGAVLAAAVTSDGRTVLSGMNHTVRVWDLASGQTRMLPGHRSRVCAVGVAPEGRIAVSGSWDHTVRVWDLASGEVRTLGEHGGWVRAVEVAPDGCTAVSGSDDGMVRV